MSGKYVVGIVGARPEERRLEAVLFSHTLTHRDVGLAIFGGLRMILSAGFYQIASDGVIETYGHSESLDLPSDPVMDPKYIHLAIYGSVHNGLQFLSPEARAELTADYTTAVTTITNRRQAKRQAT